MDQGVGAEMNFYKHHIGDYAQATGHLSFVEDAAYSRLLRKYYAEEKPLPVDLKSVQRLVGARTPEERDAVQAVLEEFFHLENDGWHNKRCDEELSKLRSVKEINRRIAKDREAAKRATSVERTQHGENFERDTVRDHNSTERDELSTLRAVSEKKREPSHKPLTISQKRDLDLDLDLDPDPKSGVSEKRGSGGKDGRRGSRLPDEWFPSNELAEWTLREQPTWTPEYLRRMVDEFHDYWRALPGQKGVKLDWDGTWRNRVRQLGPIRNSAPTPFNRPTTDPLFKVISD